MIPWSILLRRFTTYSVTKKSIILGPDTQINLVGRLHYFLYPKNKNKYSWVLIPWSIFLESSTTCSVPKIKNQSSTAAFKAAFLCHNRDTSSSGEACYFASTSFKLQSDSNIRPEIVHQTNKVFVPARYFYPPPPVLPVLPLQSCTLPYCQWLIMPPL